MITFGDIKEPLEKIINSILTRKEKGESHPKDGCISKMNAENIERASCNHLFDDYPELYGITKPEAHRIREYFNTGNYQHILDLHNNFPEIIEKEDNEWLKNINNYRKTKGIEPIVL